MAVALCSLMRTRAVRVRGVCIIFNTYIQTNPYWWIVHIHTLVPLTLSSLLPSFLRCVPSIETRSHRVNATRETAFRRWSFQLYWTKLLPRWEKMLLSSIEIGLLMKINTLLLWFLLLFFFKTNWNCSAWFWNYITKFIRERNIIVQFLNYTSLKLCCVIRSEA